MCPMGVSIGQSHVTAGARMWDVMGFWRSTCLLQVDREVQTEGQQFKASHVSGRGRIDERLRLCIEQASAVPGAT